MAILLVFAGAAGAAAQAPLARARTLYNQQKYDDAIAAAAAARTRPDTADAAALVEGRAHLERYRRTADPVDLSSAREALGAVRPAALAPREREDLVIGQGLALFLAGEFGAAAEQFEVAWGRVDTLAPGARERLVDWWAGSLDRQAQRHPAAERAPFYRRIAERAAAEAQHDPASAPAAYWLAASLRGLGDLERAASVTFAAWVRSRGAVDHGAALGGDLDRLMTQAIIPERARLAPGGRDRQDEALATLAAEWEAFKAAWP